MLLVCCLVSLVVYLLYSWLVRRHEYWNRRGVIIVRPTFLLGNMAPVLFRSCSAAHNFQACYNAYKRRGFGGFYEFLTPMFMPTDPEIIREMFVKSSEHFTDRRIIISDQTDPLIGQALINLQGDEWRSMRHRLSPAFTSGKLRAMFPLVVRCGEHLARFLTTRPHEEPLEFKAAFTRLTNDVIASVAFGHECHALKDPEEPFYKLGQEILNIGGVRVLMVFGHLLMPGVMRLLGVPLMPQKPINYFRQLILDTMRHREKEGLTRPDMLQLLMEAQKGGIKREPGEDELADELPTSVTEISDDDIAAQAFLFFLAGFETVATALSFLAHELAVNPEVQERLHTEVKVTLEQSGQFTYEAVQSMKYLDMVVQETLRKYPPAPFTDRRCTKNFLVPGTDIVIEKDIAVMLPIYPLHHDPEHFPDPEKFDPERFTEENRKNIKPYTYLPFGIGPHMCLGMRLALLEVKVCVCHMLAACELRVCSKTQVPLQLSKTTFQMTTDAGFWLSAVPRVLS